MLERPSLGRHSVRRRRRLTRRGDRPFYQQTRPAIRKPNRHVIDGHTRPQWYPYAVSIDLNHGAEGPPRGLRLPVLSYIVIDLEQIPGVNPSFVPVVRRADAPPLIAALQHTGRFPEDELAHLLGAQAGLGEQRDDRRSGDGSRGHQVPDGDPAAALAEHSR